MRIELPKPFIDERGHIQNVLELDELRGVHGVGLIYSVAGSVRSNHYHKTDAHWLYVIEGEMHYFERELSASSYPDAPVVYTAGQCVYTGPRLWHRTFFPVDTLVLSISDRPRDAASHESDLVRE